VGQLQLTEEPEGQSSIAADADAATAVDDTGDSVQIQQAAADEDQQAGQQLQQVSSGEQLPEQVQPPVEDVQEAAIAQESSKQASAVEVVASSSSFAETDAEPAVAVQAASAAVAPPIDD
jgi:hypothetical protein